MTAQYQRTIYKNPPIEEALVEFRFNSGESWDPTIPGKFHECALIKDTYTGKPREQKGFEATWHVSADTPATFAFREGFARTQLISQDGTRLASIGQDVLSVNVLRPYDSWENFRPRVERGLIAYKDVANANEIARIAVRYINKITIPNDSLALEEFFRCGPQNTPGLPEEMSGFFKRTDYLFQDGVKLQITHASVLPPEGCLAFLLDIELVREGMMAAGETTAVMAVVDDLHQREGKIFESMITDETRRLFNAD